MVEELKIIAEIMKDVTDGALWGIGFYLAVSYLKPVTITGFIIYGFVQGTKFITRGAGDAE